MTVKHDRLCPIVAPDYEAKWCHDCRVIANARADERKRCIEIAVKAAGKHPTLGQQRMLRELRGES